MKLVQKLGQHPHLMPQVNSMRGELQGPVVMVVLRVHPE
jgi:hypothetical protein